MLGDSSGVQATTATASSGGAGGEAAAPPHQLSATVSEVGHVGSNNNNSGEDDKRGSVDGDRSFGGNRWPREETLALLRIRSDMDAAFRDASVKGPLWDEVSRKLAELGYNRSAKKCREKFENVFKYHKRTKEGRTGKHEGKTYRFFDQLEAFETHPSSYSSHSQPPPPLIPQPPATTAVAMSLPSPPPPPSPPQPPPTATAFNVSTVPSTATVAISSQGFASSSGINIAANPTTILPFTQATNPTPSQYSFPNDLLSNSTSSSTSSDVEIRRRRKRKWKDFFERLLKEVIEKQEDMQRKLLEAIEKREHDRMVREESWRLQEMARINREREILAQERSISAAKDAAVMAFLQKLSDQQPQQQQQPVANNPPPPPEPVQSPPRQAMPAAAVAEPARVAEAKVEGRSDNGEQPSSSRWPKVEVQALINIRTSLDSKYQENGPKGPLWEEVSADMRKLGYNRSAKRCKEKWENINKYFKKVKESSKKRSEDSKTCPYFHQLDALYREKHSKIDQINSSVPLMVRPEQQWPPPPPPPPQPHNDSVMEDLESEDNQNHGQDDDDKMDDDDEDEGSGYEIVANSNRPTSMSSTG